VTPGLAPRIYKVQIAKNVTVKMLQNQITSDLGSGYVQYFFSNFVLSADTGIMAEGRAQASMVTRGPMADLPAFESNVANQRPITVYDINTPVYSTLEIGMSYRFWAVVGLDVVEPRVESLVRAKQSPTQGCVPRRAQGSPMI